MNKILKVAAIFLVLVNVVVIVLASANPIRSFGTVIGFGVALFLLQRFFRWIIRKTRFGAEAEWSGLFIAALLYLVVFASFSFSGLNRGVALPNNFSNDRELFTQSLASFAEANSVEYPSENRYSSIGMDSATRGRVISLLNRGINLGEQVSDEFMDYLSPELKDEFRGHLLSGEQAHIRQLSNNETSISAFQAGVMAVELREWKEWWDAHQAGILAKIGNS